MSEHTCDAASLIDEKQAEPEPGPKSGWFSTPKVRDTWLAIGYALVLSGFQFAWPKVTTGEDTTSNGLTAARVTGEMIDPTLLERGVATIPMLVTSLIAGLTLAKMLWQISDEGVNRLVSSPEPPTDWKIVAWLVGIMGAIVGSLIGASWWLSRLIGQKVTVDFGLISISVLLLVVMNSNTLVRKLRNAANNLRIERDNVQAERDRIQTDLDKVW